MRRLLNTLYITREDAFLSLDGENIVVKADSSEIARFPFHNLDSVISFSYKGATPSLMGKCVEKGITLSFCTPQGKFLARCDGRSKGNVLLRREQYRIADDEQRSLDLANMFIFGKVFNARWVIERAKRDHPLRIDENQFDIVSDHMKRALCKVRQSHSLDNLRGIEGELAAEYFKVFDQMILREKDVFFFVERNRRPPRDACNALLSYVYMLLTSMCSNALEAVGLDSYVGFLHRDRPGRTSLALDLMEELRPCMGDRFVLTLINNRVVQSSDFEFDETGSVKIKDIARREILRTWQEKKKEEITHPFLKEKVEWGLVPYIQAQLLARCIRGENEKYPPFLWK